MAGTAGTGSLASKADRAAALPELEFELELAPQLWLVLVL